MFPIFKVDVKKCYYMMYLYLNLSIRWIDGERERIKEPKEKKGGMKDIMNSDEKHSKGGKRTIPSVCSASQRGKTGNSRTFYFLSTRTR